jgi:hypothetical protein
MVCGSSEEWFAVPHIDSQTCEDLQEDSTGNAPGARIAFFDLGNSAVSEWNSSIACEHEARAHREV